MVACKAVSGSKVHRLASEFPEPAGIGACLARDVSVMSRNLSLVAAAWCPMSQRSIASGCLGWPFPSTDKDMVRAPTPAP